MTAWTTQSIPWLMPDCHKVVDKVGASGVNFMVALSFSASFVASVAFFNFHFLGKAGMQNLVAFTFKVK